MEMKKESRGEGAQGMGRRRGRERGENRWKGEKMPLHSRKRALENRWGGETRGDIEKKEKKGGENGGCRGEWNGKKA